MVADRHVGQNPVRFQLLPLVVLAAGEDLWLEGQYAAVWTPLALQELLVLQNFFHVSNTIRSLT